MALTHTATQKELAKKPDSEDFERTIFSAGLHLAGFVAALLLFEF